MKEINSLTEFVNNVLALEPKDAKVREQSPSIYYEELVYRGLSSKCYPLCPSIVSRQFEHSSNTLLYTENDLISGALAKFPDFFGNIKLPVAKLAKLQHYGIPTRMMDVTTNPFVALYFACRNTNNKKSKDGEVVVFSKGALPALNPFVNVIADTYRLISNVNTALRNFYYRAMQQDYCISLQYQGWEKENNVSIANFRKQISTIHLVESFETSNRQKNQQGKYIIFPNRIVKYKEDECDVLNELVEIDKNDEMIVERLIIPENKKIGILADLEKFGINEAYLFPDNMEKVFKSIKKSQEWRFEY